MIAHPKTVKSMMQVRMPDSLQAKQILLPDSPHSPHESRNSPDPNHRNNKGQLPVGYAPPTRARSSKLLQLSSLSRNNSVTEQTNTATRSSTPPPLINDDSFGKVVIKIDGTFLFVCLCDFFFFGFTEHNVN